MFSQNSSNYNPAVTVNNIDTESYNWKKIAMIIFAVLLVVMLILIVIHYTITPIFKTTQGSKGYIPVPGITLNDGYLYWKSPLHDELKESDTILKGDKGDMPVTFQMDILLNNVNFNLNNEKLRPIFMRYNTIGSTTSKEPNYSLGVFLEPHVNDLLVQVRTQNRDIEIVRVRNVPGKEPFRIGITLAINYFEVYYNGRLVGTRNLKNPPLQSVGFIFGNPGTAPGGASTSTPDNSLPNCQVTLSQQFKQAKDTMCSPTGSSNEHGGIMNLYIWQRVLNADEMRYSGPKMPSADYFKKASLGKSYFNLL
jgi:hypothetical protein